MPQHFEADPFPQQFTFNCFSPSVPHLVAERGTEQSTLCSAPRQICRAIRKINQLHIHYQKSCGQIYFIIGWLIFRICLAFFPFTFFFLLTYSNLTLSCWPLVEQRAMFLCWILFKGVLVLCLHLFAISCAAVWGAVKNAGPATYISE